MNKLIKMIALHITILIHDTIKSDASNQIIQMIFHKIILICYQKLDFVIIDYMQKEGSNIHLNSFSIQFDEWTTLRQLLVKYANRMAQSAFCKKYQKDLSVFIFNFRMSYEGEKWTLRKTFSQLYSFEKIMIKRYDKDIPVFPIQKQHEISIQNIDKLCEFFIFFLKKVVNSAFYDDQVQHFLNILPEKYGQGIIYGEFLFRKLSGGRYNEKSCFKSFRHLLCPCARTWRSRYFTVTDNGLFYSKGKRTFLIRDMLIYCSQFQILMGKQETDDQLGVTIISSTRKLALIAGDILVFVLFVTAISEALSNSPFNKTQRYNSFSPIRQNCTSKFYADGQEYFKDIYYELKNAKKYVFISDWMITPYFYLLRNEQNHQKMNEATEQLEFRLDKILQEIANKGVIINIILYQQPKVAINNDSEYAEKYLRKLHPNIKVIRHPNYIIIPFFWSHHQKIVLIDQRIAFIGGLDICYGRWDNKNHSLTNEKNLWSGADFCNLRITDIYYPRNFMMCSLDPKIQPRMPWHDVAVQIRGASVHDLARHFTVYWNFVTSQINLGDSQLLNLSGRHTFHFNTKSGPPPSEKNHKIVPMLQTRKNTEDVQSQLIDNLLQQQYYERYINEQVVKVGALSIPRMHVIRDNIIKMPKKILDFVREPKTQQKYLFVANENQEIKEGRYNHQFLRSASTWSLGLMQKESSIYQAYLNLIETSENFIYIQNQFFICKENLIVEKLAERINRAYETKKPFKVIIFIPLLPGFEGDVREQKSAVMRIQLYWQYWTICRSSRSLYKRLSHIKNIDNYLKFYSLRQHGATQEKLPLTEILYIHSKLMIVDDKKLIIGSANINDRSLNGQRDSEIGICIEEQDLVPTEWGYNISPGIQQFRVRLFKQHFGQMSANMTNYLDEQFWQTAQERAKRNTQIYRQVFGCYPDDQMRKFAQIEQIFNKSNLARYEKLKNEIKGHVVQLPLKFLEEQNLNLTAKEKEYFLPLIFFT